LNTDRVAFQIGGGHVRHELDEIFADAPPSLAFRGAGWCAKRELFRGGVICRQLE
jgi:hypothetical protein